MECRIALHSNQLTKKNCAIGCAAQAGFQTYPKHDWRECIMQPTSVYLTVSASHPAWVCKPAARVAVDSFDFSALAPLRPAIVLRRNVRCLRKFVRPRPLLRHSLCRVRRHKLEHPSDIPCASVLMLVHNDDHPHPW